MGTLDRPASIAEIAKQWLGGSKIAFIQKAQSLDLYYTNAGEISIIGYSWQIGKENAR
jgi:hypothetical protein